MLVRDVIIYAPDKSSIHLSVVLNFIVASYESIRSQAMIFFIVFQMDFQLNLFKYC